MELKERIEKITESAAKLGVNTKETAVILAQETGVFTKRTAIRILNLLIKEAKKTPGVLKEIKRNIKKEGFKIKLFKKNEEDFEVEE